MKVIYFTTSIEANDYVDFNSCWKSSLNPSNQNFHNKIIRALSLTNSVEVISIRPFSRSLCNVKKLDKVSKEDGNINWHYLEIKNNPISRLFSIKKEAKEIMSTLDLNYAVIVTDTINPRVVSLALKMGKEFSLPVIGLCTDSPSNITGTKKSYTLYVLNKGHKLNGYVALTQGLNDLFNTDEKPNLIMEGIVENELPKAMKNINGKYFFFGGALMKRYGIYDLIDAFKQLNREDIKLLICGHHADQNELLEAIGNNQNIEYLKTLPVSQVLQYEMNAIANINPRPYSEDLDRFSIPSKTIEYLSSGRPTISVKNTRLQKDFLEDAIWAKSSNPEDLLSAMNRVLELSDVEQENLGEKARSKVLALYSLSNINKKLSKFLESFLR